MYETIEQQKGLNMIQLDFLRKITGLFGFVVFIWCFGAIFDGAHDPIFGHGVARLATIGIMAVVPYIVTASAQNSILRKRHAKIEALIFANRLSDAETELREIGTHVSNDSMQGTFIGLKLLSVVLEKRGRYVDALKILKAIVKKCPDVRTRLLELEGRASAPTSVHSPGGDVNITK
jgi:hypothetical protein